MSKAKSISKSIRLTEEIYNYINSYDGDGFNCKFENIILDAMFTEKERRHQLQELDGRIARQRQELEKLLADCRAMQQLARDAVWVSERVASMRKNVSQLHVAAAPGPGVDEIQEGDC